MDNYESQLFFIPERVTLEVKYEKLIERLEKLEK